MFEFSTTTEWGLLFLLAVFPGLPLAFSTGILWERLGNEKSEEK